VESQDQFPCPECGKSFRKNSNLQCHISAVHRISVSNCDKCGKGFKNPYYLRHHVNKVHNVQQVICDVCSKICKSKGNLYNHKRDVHETIENLACDLCGELQKNYSYLSRHKNRFCKFKSVYNSGKVKNIVKKEQTSNNTAITIENHKPNATEDENSTIMNVEDENYTKDGFNEENNMDGDEISTSDVTSQTLNDSTEFEQEINTITQNSRSIFSTNTKIQSENESIREENEEHNGDWDFCELEPDFSKNADFILKSENAVNRNEDPAETIKLENSDLEEVDDGKHENNIGMKIDKPKHDPKPEVKCFQCKEVFQHNRNLVSHMREMHKKPEKTACDICHKEFKTYLLKKHVEIVHTKEISSCDECGKVFNCRKYLTDHKRSVHREAEMLSCEYCSKQFKDFMLKAHIRNVHSQENSSCDDCGKVYPSVKGLRDHQRTVHRNLDLFCDLCGKNFKCKSYLAIHVRRYHNAVYEDQSCDQCDKVFKTKNDLYLHNKSVHTVENIPCTICGKVSRNKYTLKKHMNHNHSN